MKSIASSSRACLQVPSRFAPSTSTRTNSPFAAGRSHTLAGSWVSETERGSRQGLRGFASESYAP